ncbi:MAG: flagellar hook capping FlgD N-terminal domain-containing protein [bacterium]|nr:flagellar hook capping FlgD N-terminal domain-containing protein [bacterium]
MSDAISNILGTQTSTTSSTTSTTAGGSLGKDAFLQLLVTQMKYQDPLNPSSDTEYIAQLATFSQLEQMQNLNSTYTNSQALSMVGKTVSIKTTDSAGNEKYVNGAVDYVTITNGTAKLSVNGSLYTLDQVTDVYDDYYVLSLGTPTVEEKKTEFDHENPTDVSVKVDLGTTSVATALAVIIDNTAVDSKYLSMSDGVLTIDKEAFAALKEGEYDVIFSFNDALSTVVNKKLTITVKGEPAVSDTTETEEEITE